MTSEKTSVVICGAGPVGLILAHLLGQQQVDTILIEQLPHTVTEPRAIAIDSESLRTLQQVEMLEGFEKELLPGLTAIYENAEGIELFRAGTPDHKPYGYSTVNSFDQPKLDRHLAENLQHRESVQLRFSTTLEGFEQNEDEVRVLCVDADGNETEIHCDYLVGADGGRSTIRSLLNIEMRGESNPQPWLVIDTIDPHLDGQLDCHFYCNPARPGMTMRKQHSERRWEWMLMPGEKREDLLKDDTIRSIISPYTDAENVNIYRKRVYDFHAIIADDWRDQRVFLVGDAAHMTPPFAGQGLNSGLRDAANLAWKLAAIVAQKAVPSILDSYETERKKHAWQLIQSALDLGKQIQPITAEEASERDALFAEINRDPASKKALEEKTGLSILMRSVAGGLVVEGKGLGAAGRLLIQPPVQLSDGEVRLLDRCLGSSFSLIGYNCDPSQVLDDQALSPWLDIGTNVVAISSAEDRAAEGWIYDKYQKLGEWLQETSPCILLVRPDRFCMLAAAPNDVKKELLEGFSLLFGAYPVAAEDQSMKNSVA